MIERRTHDGHLSLGVAFGRPFPCATDECDLLIALHCGLAVPIVVGLGIDEWTNAHNYEITLELREFVRQASMPSRDRIGAQPLASQPQILREERR